MTQKFNLSTVIIVVVAVVIAIGGLGGGYYLYNKATKLQINADSTVITEIQGTGAFGSVLFGKNNYELNYSESPADIVEILSNFEVGDNWESTGYWDKRIYLQGESSLALNAENRTPQTATYTFETEKNFNNIQYIRYFINLSDYQALESHTIKLGDENFANYYSYSITNVKTGWNTVKVPVNQMIKVGTSAEFDLSKIKKLQLELISRPQNSLVANFDYLKIKKDDNFANDWQTVDELFTAQSKFNDKIVFEGVKANGFTSTLAAVPGLKDFVYEAKVSPQTRNSSAGLFFRGSYKNSKGYYFVTGGVDSNTWYLKKYSDDGWEDLLKGEISNFNYEVDKFYWLRVVANGNELKLLFSINGEDFTELATVTDDTYLSGGVGVAVFADYAYFDDFKVKK